MNFDKDEFLVSYDRTTHNTLATIVLGTILLLVVAVVMNMAFEDEQIQVDSYCENVAEKIWPDYKGIFETECKKPQK